MYTNLFHKRSNQSMSSSITVNVMDHQLIFGLFRNKTCILGFIKFPLLFSNFPTKRIRWKGRRSAYIYQVVVPLNLVLRAHGIDFGISHKTVFSILFQRG
jgi:hypothetical protein